MRSASIRLWLCTIVVWLAAITPSSDAAPFGAATVFGDVADHVFLGDLSPESSYVGTGELQVNKVSGGATVLVNGVESRHYLAARGASIITYNLPKGARRFTAVGTTPRLSQYTGQFFLQVLVDGEMKFRSGRIADLPGRQAAIAIDIPAGSKRITLIAVDEGDATGDLAIWADAYVDTGGPLSATAPRDVVGKLPAELLQAVAVINGDKGSGTGFIGRLHGTIFLFTNQHVLAGNSRVTVTTSAGRSLSLGNIYVARDRDVAMIRLVGSAEELEGLPALEVADDAISEAPVGSSIVVPGNSEGGGSIIPASGRVVGFGGDRIEHNAPAVRGNSGSPVVASTSGKVVGVHAFVIMRPRDPISDAVRSRSDSNLNEIRQFGVRIDSVARTDWELIDWDDWHRQCAILDGLQDDADALYAFLANNRSKWVTNSGFAVRVQDFDHKMRNLDVSGVAYRQQIDALLAYLRAFGQQIGRQGRSPQGVTYGWLRLQAAEIGQQGDALAKVLDDARLRINDILKNLPTG